MNKTFIFSHKGHLAAIVPTDCPFINDPFAKGQLGCVISTGNVKITQEAKDLINSHHRREGGSFASFMLTKHDPSIQTTFGKSSIGIMSIGNVYLGEEIEIGRDCDLSVLDDCELTTDAAPADFIEAVENQLVLSETNNAAN